MPRLATWHLMRQATTYKEGLAMDMSTLIAICKRYSDMGSAIQEQLAVVAADEMRLGNINSNALHYIADWLDYVYNNGLSDEDSDLAYEIDDMQDRIQEFDELVQAKLDDEEEADRIADEMEEDEEDW